MSLHSCDACLRHVRSSPCPFCGAAVASIAAPPVGGRVARGIVLPAACAAAMVAACNDAKAPNEVTVQGVDAGPTANSTATRAPDAAASVETPVLVAPPYGNAPFDPAWETI